MRGLYLSLRDLSLYASIPSAARSILPDRQPRPILQAYHL